MKTLPVARTQNLVMQNFNKEVLLYDLLTNRAYCLNETAAIVYLACDGKTEFNDLTDKYQFTEELIYLSLQVLEKDNLIAPVEHHHFGDLSRRELVKKAGLASMIALPMISSLIAPTGVMALSCVSGTLLPGEDVGAGCVPGVACSIASATCCDGIGPGNCCSGTASFNYCVDVVQFNCAQCICTCG